jgi:hypothetical protein
VQTDRPNTVNPAVEKNLPPAGITRSTGARWRKNIS